MKAPDPPEMAQSPSRSDVILVLRTNFGPARPKHRFQFAHAEPRRRGGVPSVALD
jgi:hypothetical protein